MGVNPITIHDPGNVEYKDLSSQVIIFYFF